MPDGKGKSPDTDVLAEGDSNGGDQSCIECCYIIYTCTAEGSGVQLNGAAGHIGSESQTAPDINNTRTS